MHNKRTKTMITIRAAKHLLVLRSPAASVNATLRYPTNSYFYSRLLSSPVTDGAPKPFQDIPGPKGYPLIGTALDYRNDKYTFHRVIEKRLAKFGPIYREKMFPGLPEQVVVFLPEDVEAVFRSDSEWPNRPEGGEVTQKLLKDSGLTEIGIISS